MAKKFAYKNEVTREGRLVVVRVMGDQTKHTIAGINDAANKLQNKSKTGRYILVDLSGVGRVDKGALVRAAAFMKGLPYERIALFGADSGFLSTLMKLTISSVADNSKIKLFSNEQNARDWLRQSRTTEFLKPIYLVHPRFKAKA